MTDYQRSKVYAWEDKIVKPFDKTNIPFDQIQGMVNMLWMDMGLKFPPKVLPLDKRIKRHMATGSRTSLHFRETAPSWIILHELAHALASTFDGASDQHGPLYVGLYVQLLVKYMRMDRAYLLMTLDERKIDVDVNAEPLFVE